MITTNLQMIVAPSDTSGFYWMFFGIPTGIIEVNYDRQPPILVYAEGSTDVTYSVVGLPTGMSYSNTSGELSGTNTEIGIYPVAFTAVDNTTGDTIALTIEFIVLPPGGGDETQIPGELLGAEGRSSRRATRARTPGWERRSSTPTAPPPTASTPPSTA